MLAGVILLAMFLSYNPAGSSFNTAGMFAEESSLELIRNTTADLFFQIFGTAAYLIPAFFIFCSWQIYTKRTISFLKYKIMSFFYAIITVPPLLSIFFEKSAGGVLGMFLKYEITFLSQFSYIFIILSFTALLFAFSISWKDIITTKNALILFSKFIYKKITTFKNKDNNADYNYNPPSDKINIMPNLESVKSNMNEDFKHSIFYKNIQAAQNFNEENYEEEYNNEPLADLQKDFSAEFKAFNAHKEKNFNTEPISYPSAPEDSFKESHTHQLKEYFDNEKIRPPHPINKTNTEQITPKLPPTAAYFDAKHQSPSASLQAEQYTSSTDNIKIQLSKEGEQASALKEKITKNYHIPLNFLNIKPQKNSTTAFEIQQNAKNLEQIIQEFGVNCKVMNAITGPVVTLYEIAIPAGVKTSKITALETDIALRMKAASVRIAIVPGKDVVGVEIPNSNRKTVFLKEILQSKAFKETSAKLPVALGYDINGNAIVADLATMPHLLIAGTTGSGKSVGVNGMILSLLYKLPPEQCKLIMIDPKMLELSVYQDIPHLLTPVVINPKQAISALKWVVKEMENRYYQMSLLAVRNITGFNEKLKNTAAIEKIQNDLYDAQGLDITFKHLPYIVVIIDEMADLMMVAGKEVEMAVQRLAQMARAAGIHLIMATQRPSVNVITGTIKANFPTRISFQVSSGIDSKTIINETGAEQLLGKGDMLFMSGAGRIQRIHGAFVDDSEVSSIVDYLKDLSTPNYIDNITSVNITAYDTDDDSGEKDELYAQVIELIQTERKISTSFIQRKFQIGYNRAARIMEQLEEDGIISKANAMGKREILIK